MVLYTNNQLAVACSMLIIILRIIYFTVVLCVHVTVLYLFYIKQWFTNLFLFHFQTKDSDTHAYAHSWSPNDGDRNQQND